MDDKRQRFYNAMSETIKEDKDGEFGGFMGAPLGIDENG